MTMHRPGRVHGVDGGDAAAARHPRHQPRHHPGLAHSRQHREVKPLSLLFQRFPNIFSSLYLLASNVQRLNTRVLRSECNIYLYTWWL